MGNQNSSQQVQLLDAAAAGDLRALSSQIENNNVNTQDEVGLPVKGLLPERI